MITQFTISEMMTEQRGEDDIGLCIEYNLSIVTGNKISTSLRFRKICGVDTVLINGAAVCRSTVTNPTDGCVPINPFGAGSYSPQAIAYFTATSQKQTRVVQRIYQANANGQLFGGIGAG
ncbi:MAG: hypothetical protein EOO00_11180, partial [Chitinophagaceae bacterium]